jgi:FtsP/CotA-like multicopper oxidase with cupredoxin domain
MANKQNRTIAVASAGVFVLVIVSLAVTSKGCGSDLSTSNVASTSLLASPSSNPVPLNPTTIPKFVTQLPIPPVFAPTVIKDGSGQVIRNEYTITDSQTTVQMLPAGFPSTTVLAMGGPVLNNGNSLASSGTFQGSPSASFENTRGIPTVVHWRTNIQQPAFLPMDPTIHWADPQAIEKPTPPFNLFPPGYSKAQFPVAHVTHTHGLMVLPQMDGTAEEWFTNVQFRGPSFVTEDYTMPNDQPPTQLFYHDHVMGVTRVGIYAGEVGTAYFIRDPNNPLDQPTSPLPKGPFEIPLAVFSRAFFTNGQLHFPPDPGTLNAGADAPPNIAYWSYNESADTVLVNGVTWPNLNVQRQQYRFRVLAAANTQLWDFQLVNASNGNAVVPFTIIGSDGGYLPAPQVVTHVQLGITERADILVDFSQFAAGTQIIMNNNFVGSTDSPTLGTVMRFTVQPGTANPPRALDPSLFPKRATLTADAPTRFKVLRIFDDLRDSKGNCSDPALFQCNQRSIDALEFTTPTTEFPLVGSTEEWDIIHTNSPDNGDQDNNFHQIHIHLLEFQILNRQPFDNIRYRNDWHVLNGHMPVSRPIVLDPTPYFTGPVQPPAPYETGWKDTAQAPPAMITRLMVRWAPQESTNATPGVNQFSIDPTSFPDPVAGPGYVWHCHIVGHEDHDMMRTFAVVNNWAAGKSYQAGNVVAFNNIDYRARAAFTSAVGQTPDTRFDLWARVNNNDGTWQPQIIYAQNDRVLSGGLLYAARSVFQAQTGQTPAANPTLWQALPMTACGQLAQFCQGISNPPAAQCQRDGQKGIETTCLNEIEPCLSYCQPQQARPCSGLCNNPVRFSVADGSTFQSGNLGTGTTCFETTSRLFQGSSSGFVAGESLTVNGRTEPLNGNWNYPLPPMRDDGYCIQTTTGNQSSANFSAF